MKVLGLCGSTRENSFNRWLLESAGQYLGDEIEFVIATPNDIPLYNEDDDGKKKPGEVKSFLDQVNESDVLIFASPEYNHGTSGALKNMIDWASRPAFNSPLLAKPCGILTASMSPVGGARAQADLKNILSSTLSLVFPSVEFLVPSAHEKFSEQGVLNDKETQRRLERYVTGLVKWVQEIDKEE